MAVNAYGLERMACHMLACIRHRRPSLLMVVLGTALICPIHTDLWAGVSSPATLHEHLSKLLSGPCFQNAPKGARAVDPTMRQAVLDLDGDCVLIPVSPTKLISSAVVLLRLPPCHARGTDILADGSGLWRLNRLSAAQLVTVLIGLAQDFRVRPEDVASLRTPNAGRRRTPRFQVSDFTQRARLKAGSSLMSARWRGRSTGLMAS